MVKSSKPLANHPVRLQRSSALAIVALLGWSAVGAAHLARAVQEPAPVGMGTDSAVETSEAEHFLERGDAKAAERAFRRLLLANPDSARAMVGWARALALQDRGGEALPSLRRLAEQRVVAGRFNEASSLFETAVGIAPEEPQLRSRYGQILALDRRYRSAGEQLARAYRSGADDPTTLLYWASALWENGDIVEAESRYRRAVEASGRSPSALHQLGRLLLWQSRFDEAVAAFDEAAGSGASGLDFELDRARALGGSLEESAGAIAAAGNDLASSSRAALAERTVDAYRRVVAQAPRHSQARYGLMMALRHAGSEEEAAAERESLAELYEEDRLRARESSRTGARVATAQRELNAGNASGALEALAGIEGDVDALRLEALCRRALGQRELAAEVLRRAIPLAPERTELRTLLREIERDGS